MHFGWSRWSAPSITPLLLLLTAQVGKPKTKMQSMTAKSAKLGKEVATLKSWLCALNNVQAEIDQNPAENTFVFENFSPETRKVVDRA